MVVSSSELVWHDLECGSYGADLALWRELAESVTARTEGAPATADAERDGATGARVLDMGAGSGRVSLELARAGHHVTAVDINRELLDALGARAAVGSVEVVCADARSFELGERDFNLCIVAMQTIQLLSGAAERIEFLRRARAHLLPGGLLACAIVTEVEQFDCALGDIAPSAETVRIDGLEYVSRVTRVHALEARAVIERERWILAPGERPTAGAHAAIARPRAARAQPYAAEAQPHEAQARLPELHVSELDLVSPAELEREAVTAGLRPEPAREVAATEEHVGSTVVMLSA